MSKKLLILLFTVVTTLSFAQSNIAWKFVNDNKLNISAKQKNKIYSENQKLVYFDAFEFKKSLLNVTAKSLSNKGKEIVLPNVIGEMERFSVWESSNFDAELQAKFPEIRAYVGRGITDPTATLYFSFSPSGIQTMVMRAGEGSEFIESYANDNFTYVVFDSKTRIKENSTFQCTTKGDSLAKELTTATNRYAKAAGTSSLRTFRLALSCTGEYAQFFGGTVSGALAGMNATMSRCNGIFEKDLAVKLVLIGNNESIIYTNPAADPYSDAVIGVDDANSSNTNGWGLQLQNNLTATIGNSAYDVGHLFGASGGGGNSGCIGCVCNNDTLSTLDFNKGSAYTSPLNGIPQGDTFDIDVVIHEFGHQLGASHTHTYSYEGSEAQVEPGSGSTIMSYAGITGFATDVQNHSDDFFAYVSINQIQNVLAVKTCPVLTPYTNSKPVVSAGTDYIIPKGTAFILTGMATDTDGDAMTYIWEENDVGTSATVGSSSKVSSTKAEGPNFRTFTPITTPVRYLPSLSHVLANELSNPANWEAVYSGATARLFNFAFTARDNHVGCGQTATDFMKVTMDLKKGPFVVMSQTSAVTYAAGSTQTVKWNVAGTNGLTGASTVDIYLSTNVNGDNTTFTLIKAGATNNGTTSVVLPDMSTGSTACRFMVKASNNIFYSVNMTNFTITPNLAVDDFVIQNFELYPNPNNGSFKLQFDNPTSKEILVNVFDIRGRKIFESNYANQTTFNETIQLNAVETGMYLVSVSSGNQKVVKKIIVE
jgi:hypothetical protein